MLPATYFEVGIHAEKCGAYSTVSAGESDRLRMVNYVTSRDAVRQLPSLVRRNTCAVDVSSAIHCHPTKAFRCTMDFELEGHRKR